MQQSFQTTKLWIASGNKSKLQELKDLSIDVLPRFLDVTSREPKNVIESESTFHGNAELKAKALVKELLNENHESFCVLADDSGLSVDLLHGAPGVRSGRFSTEDSKSNLETLIEKLNSITLDVKKRTGFYFCALYFVEVKNRLITRELASEGIRDGLIGTIPKGNNGYAYDPIFLDPYSLLSYGEISYDEKQKDSHRRRAIENLKSALLESIQ